MPAIAGPSSRLAERQSAFPPTASTDSIARRAASERSTAMICRSIATGVGRSPLAFDSSMRACFSFSRSCRSRAIFASARAGSATRSSR